MIVELHMLQNFAPSNLNRDDTGSPKDCEFGGYRRARISSQCQKRAIRKDSEFAPLMEQSGAVRSRVLITELAEQVANDRPAPKAVVKMITDIFQAGGVSAKGKDEPITNILLFIPRATITKMAEVIQSKLEELAKGDSQAQSTAVEQLGTMIAAGVSAPDIALFGRMIEVKGTTPWGKKQLGVDAACQVAHAISTNKVRTEFDFFTAVDDLKGAEEDAGAGMLGTVEFNSSCYYRYANVDLDQLHKNFDGDGELIGATLEAFLRAMVSAVPTGKQNSFAAHNPPSLVFGVVRGRGNWSLANAFVKPVGPTRDRDLIGGSIAALDGYWARLTAMYGSNHVSSTCVVVDGDYASELNTLGGSRVEGIDALVGSVLAAATMTAGNEE